MGIKEIIEKQNAERMAAARAAQDSQDNEENSQAPAPVAQRAVPPIVPKRTKAEEVIFKSVRANLGFFYYPGLRAQFMHGYLITDDPEIISYVKNQFVEAAMVSIVEDGPLKEEQ